jgi:hypothetical protein
MKCLITAVLVTVFGAGHALADDHSLRRDGRPQAAKQPTTISGKRAWLRENTVKGLKDVKQVQQVHAVLNQLTPKQLNGLMDIALAQQLPADDARLQQAQWELERARALRDALAREYLRRRGNVGYAPVITWLPEGTQLGASAVVSPDRRHVRINAMPFFSSIGPVYNYHIPTGRTWLAPPYRYPQYPNNHYNNPGYNYPQYNRHTGSRHGQMPPQHLPPPAPAAYPKRVWHDGMRTRTD